MYQTTNQTPFAELANLDGGDYTLSVDISLDLEDDREAADGHWASDRREPVIGSFAIAAGRRDGRWYLMVSPTTTAQDGDIENAGPPIVDLRDQTEGPDPLSLLRALLSGGSA